MFEPNASWSLPQHLYLVSEWSARCAEEGNPQSCVNALQNPGNPPDFRAGLALRQCAQGLDKPPCQRVIKSLGISADLVAELRQMIMRQCKPTQTLTECYMALGTAAISPRLRQQLAASKRLAPRTMLGRTLRTCSTRTTFRGPIMCWREKSLTVKMTARQLVYNTGKTPGPRVFGIPCPSLIPSKKTGSWEASSR